MFSRWGAFVYRHRRPVLLLSIVVALAAATLATQASSALSSGGWLDASSESADVSDRLDTEFGAGKSSIIALFRSETPGADATAPAFQAAIATAVAGLAEDARVTQVVGYAETGRRRFVSEAGDAAYVVVELDMTNEESVEAVDDIRAEIAPAGRVSRLAHRLRTDHQGLGRAVRGGPPAGRGRLAADRRARPDPRLRVGRRGRDAAPRGRPRDPDQPRADLPRRPAGRDEHLRPEHRDDARAGPGDRLLAVHRQPLPRGAASRPDGRRGRRTGGRHGRQGGPVLRASRSRSGCPACCCSRRRRSARSGSAGPSSSSARWSSR